MKKYLMLLLLCPLFLACSDDDEVTPELKLSKTAVELDVENDHVGVDIIEANGECSAISSDEKVALIGVNNEDKKVYIYGVGMGEATITVKDAIGVVATIKVSVGEGVLPLPETNPLAISINEGEVKELAYPLTMKGAYKAGSKNPDIATININRNNKKIEITGVTSGKTELYIYSDNTNNVKFIYEVTVAKL
ncbi:hypothetical protein JGH11_08520 [Dysgonomonas sp. Marseille-P4677]|uniref:hypothetical protein n=1 Tax=Dysgonomonas sp. Marseille-P4677 TaxID=2364790 RepID=UPI0019123AD7|nr:hypothetical protein [Dysgonomonas sp. Marseille-P4677]MBK5720912.1 hypothetical protein [Dysgonomonas sp. Marseille-P4677]